jgi:hypothetical protein
MGFDSTLQLILTILLAHYIKSNNEDIPILDKTNGGWLVVFKCHLFSSTIEVWT